MERPVSKIPTKSIPVSNIPVPSKSRESQKARSKSVESRIPKMTSHNNDQQGQNIRYGLDPYKSKPPQQRKNSLTRDSYTALHESQDNNVKSDFSKVFKHDNRQLPEFEKDFGPFGSTVLREVEQGSPQEDISTMFQRPDFNPREQMRPGTTPTGNSWIQNFDHQTDSKSAAGYQQKSRLPSSTRRNSTNTGYGYTAQDLDDILAKYKNKVSSNTDDEGHGFNKYENLDPDFTTQEYPFHKNCKNDKVVGSVLTNTQVGYPISNQIKNRDNSYAKSFAHHPDEHNMKSYADDQMNKVYKISSKHTFPFLETGDGKLIVLPEQVAFESKKISVLVSDPSKIGSIRAEKVLGPREQDHVLQQVEEVIQRSLSHGFTNKDANLNHSKYDAYGKVIPSVVDPQYWNNTKTLDEHDDYWDKEIVTMKYSDATQGSGKLMVDLHQRIKMGTNADTHVVIGDKIYPVHSIALEVYSNFFERLSRPRESIRKIQLPETEISPEIFPTLMNWIMQNDEGRDSVMNKSNVIALFSCAQYLDIPELKSQCINFLHEKVETNDRQLMQLWDEVKKRQNCQELMAVISSKAAASFQQIYKSRQFLNLDVNEIVMLLSSDEIVIESELDAYDTAIRWLLHIWSERKNYTNQIMCTVRFGLLTPLQLTQIAHCPDFSKGNNAQEYAQVLAYGSVKAMIDDGLAYSIVAESYKDQPEELKHWIETTGIRAPRHRTHLDFTSKSKSFNYHKESVQSFQSQREDLSRVESERKPSYTIFKGTSQENSSKSILLNNPLNDRSRSRSRRSVADNFKEENLSHTERSKSRPQSQTRSQSANSHRKIPSEISPSDNFSHHPTHFPSTTADAKGSNLEQVSQMLGQPIKQEDIAHLTGATNSSASNKGKHPSTNQSWHQ